MVLLTSRLVGQDCYVDSTKHEIKSDYRNLWIGETYQGTIGESNQRIDIRFTKITRDSKDNYKYSVAGKSKVNSNICDFNGELVVDKILILDYKNMECEGPDYSNGIISGKYELKENPKQSHVGIFTGEFNIMFDKIPSGYELSYGWYDIERVNEFSGNWKDYNSEKPKFCSWSHYIPPSQNNDLFRQYDNEFYIFNPEFLKKGWKTFILANLSNFTIVPKDFDTDKPRYSDDFYEYSKEEIEKSIEIEKTEWWK